MNPAPQEVQEQNRFMGNVTWNANTWNANTEDAHVSQPKGGSPRLRWSRKGYSDRNHKYTYEKDSLQCLAHSRS